VALLLIAGFFVSTKKANPSASNANSISKVTPTPSSSATASSSTSSWSGQIVGDPAPQNGFGNTFKIYVCDQNLSAKTLSVSSAEVTKADLPKAYVVSNDPVCGNGFDTIYLSGPVPRNPKNYKLTGKTKSGVSVKYSFSVKLA
jgi:hypothetical protein